MSRSFTASESDHIRAGDIAAVDITGTAWTIAVWFKVNSFAVERKIIAKWDDGQGTAGHQYLLSVNTSGRVVGAIRNASGTSSIITGSTTIATAAWVFAVLRQNGTGASTLTLRVNGVANGSTSTTAGPGNRTSLFKIGAGGDADTHEQPHDGLVSRVAIWNGTHLSDSVVDELLVRSPDDVAPTGLSFYTIDKVDEVVDYAGGATLTDSGTTYSSDEPFAELDAGVNTIAFSAPAAVLATSGTVDLSAGLCTITFTAPAALLVEPGLLAAGVNTIAFSAPTASLQVSGTAILPAGVNTVQFVAPLAAIPGTGEFLAWLAEVSTSRVILCELQPAEKLTGWAPVIGNPNTYSRGWASIIQAGVVPGGAYRRLDSVRQNDVELTPRASIGAVNANLGSWYFDEAAGMLHVSTTTASDPDAFAAIAAYFSLFLATEPADFVGGQLYEPRLTGELPTVQAAADDPFTPVKTLVEGVIQAVNAHAFFDTIADTYVWRNKTARLLLGGGDLPRESCAQIAVCEIDYLAVADDTVKLGIRSLASWLEQTLPLHVFTRDEYPRLADGLEGTYKPLLYGAKANIPGLCVDMYARANPEFPPGVAGYQDVYLVADPAAQVLTSITAVRAVNRTTGEIRGLGLSQYSVNLAACTVTVTTDAFRADEWDLRIDATGESDGLGGYLSTFGEIARDILLTLGESATNIDATSFAAADARAPFPLGLWIREPQQATEVMALLQQSVIGGVFVGTDGRWKAYVLDASDDPDPVAELDDTDFASWAPVERIDPVYPLVRCFYNEDPSTNEERLTTAQQDAARYLFETSDGLSVHTALLEASDAQIIAQRYRLLATAPDHQFDVAMRGLGLMTANLYDRVLVTRQRAPGGSYSAKRMEIIAFTKTLGPPGVQVRLGDIAGISDLVARIRAWAPDSVPAWGVATAEQRDTYAFWHDDADEVVAGVSEHSVWW